MNKTIINNFIEQDKANIKAKREYEKELSRLLIDKERIPTKAFVEEYREHERNNELTQEEESLKERIRVIEKYIPNPCRCGSDKTPIADSDDMVPCWTIECPDCNQSQYSEGERWTLIGALNKWNKENPKQE